MGARVDIGVGGRFHAEIMAGQLRRGGYETHLYTSFPRSRFDHLEPRFIHPHLLPEVVFRVGRKLGWENGADLFKMKSFGSAMARDIRRSGHQSALFIGWSSFSLETLRLKHAGRSFVVRDSAHIRFQSRVLRQAYADVGLAWPDRTVCEERELEEYERADGVIVLSEFARKTFVEEGVDPEKIRVLPLGLDLSRFRPKPPRPVSLPLRVVYFGALSVRKGVHHLLEATSEFSSQSLNLTLIGGMEPHFGRFLKRHSHPRYLGPLPQDMLARKLHEFDVFVFPTLEDGFGQTLPQAMAAGLVPVVTDHCGAADLVDEGTNGFKIPAGDPTAIRHALLRLTENPSILKDLARQGARSAATRTWDAYGDDLLKLIQQ